MPILPSILAALSVAVAVQAAPGNIGTSLTKRYCGFQFTCPCTLNEASGCVPQFDVCEQVWYWPPACMECETTLYAEQPKRSEMPNYGTKDKAWLG
ncbi:hypothetical protein B0H14DRAFT_3492418 [Mycena olivaceomarginata]|nr:hypothetical protein B0H14DRAFT_3492418 [Mycena olivaceomarginata]